MGGSKSQTVTNKSDPWGPAKGYLREGLGMASDLYDQGGFDATPYQGQRIATPSAATTQAQGMVTDMAAGGAPLVDAASGSLARMMDPSYTSSQLDAVKRNALGSAIPAATAMFSGSGMTNGSAAMDSVGRAATDAVAPYEYGAYENAQGRALQAAGMAPQITQAGYIPATMMAGVGQAQDTLAQQNINADMAKYTEGRDAKQTELRNYLQTIMGLGGMGGTQTSTQPGVSGMSSLLGAGASGLGTYGALLGAGLGGPLAIGGGLLAGLSGLF